jgi:predicted esterase
MSANGSSGRQARPIVSDGQPRPGVRVRVNPREFAGEPVYYTLYLPADWSAERKWPLVVEFPGNRYHLPHEQIYTGSVDDCRMGYDLTRGVGSVWLAISPVGMRCSPRANAPLWWGGQGPQDPEGQRATVMLVKQTLARVIPAYAIDTRKVVGVGFSRGAVALGYIGLADDELSRVWAGLWAHSHFDGFGLTQDPGQTRLRRLGKRPVMLTWGEDDSGRADSEKALAALKSIGAQVTGHMVPEVGHTDGWPDQQPVVLPFVRSWYQRIIGP